jgi:hypothetical protein
MEKFRYKMKANKKRKIQVPYSPSLSITQVDKKYRSLQNSPNMITNRGNNFIAVTGGDDKNG